jgi:hypothetical protein
LISEPNSPKRAYLLGEKMSKSRDEGEVPQQQFDEDNNPVVIEEDSKSGTHKAPTLEDLIRKLEKLKAENMKLRVKDKKGTPYSSSSEDSDSNEEVSKKEKKGRNKHDKHSYNTMSFNYNYMPSSTAYTFIPVGKAPRFDEMNYNQWKHCMKNYLYSISPEVWQVVYDGVDFSDEDEQLWINFKRFTATLKQSSSLPHRWTNKS